jgi:glc operon protein GlcG
VECFWRIITNYFDFKTIKYGGKVQTYTALKLTQQAAMGILRQTLEAAKETGRPVSVAVVDDGGHLLAFSRSDHAELYTIQIALAKARTAALTRHPSGKKSPTGNERSDHHALAITLAAGTDVFVSMPGGVPITVNGQVVGGVGVSGAGHKDQDIAGTAVDLENE